MTNFTIYVSIMISCINICLGVLHQRMFLIGWYASKPLKAVWRFPFLFCRPQYATWTHTKTATYKKIAQIHIMHTKTKAHSRHHITQIHTIHTKTKVYTRHEITQIHTIHTKTKVYTRHEITQIHRIHTKTKVHSRHATWRQPVKSTYKKPSKNLN